MAAIQALAVGTPWAATFADPEMVQNVRGVLASHFATAQQIQRQAHAHASPGNAAGQAFLAQLRAGSN